MQPQLLNLSPLLQDLDFWLERYQTAGIGLVALVIAGLQVWVSIQQTGITKRQTSIMEEQVRLAMAEKAIEGALARATIKEFVNGLTNARYAPVFTGQQITRAEFLVGIPAVNIDQIKDAAIHGYPENVDMILDLAWAADTAHKIGLEYAVQPWRDAEDEISNAVGPADWTEREKVQTERTKSAAQAFRSAFDVVQQAI